MYHGKKSAGMVWKSEASVKRVFGEGAGLTGFPSGLLVLIEMPVLKWRA